MESSTIAPGASPSVHTEAPLGPTNKGPDAARVAAQEFEALFLAQVLNQMFAGVRTDGPFGGGVAEGIYRNMLNEEYAKIIGRVGGVGVADAVYREILKLQEIE